MKYSKTHFAYTSRFLGWNIALIPSIPYIWIKRYLPLPVVFMYSHFPSAGYTRIFKLWNLSMKPTAMGKGCFLIWGNR